MSISTLEKLSHEVLRRRYKKAINLLKRAWPGMSKEELRAEVRSYVCPGGEGPDGEPTPAGWVAAAEDLAHEIWSEGEADRRFCQMAYGD